MKKFKEVVTTTIVNEDNKVETRTITKLHTIRSWSELSREEQEKIIEKDSETIYQVYQEELYENYKMNLEEIREDFKNIDFEDIYIDSNSQGYWIDSIKNFKYHAEPIEVYGETLEVYDIDFHIRKFIEDFDLDIDGYYIDSDKYEKIIKTKKYLNWVDNIHNDIQNWIDRINEEVAYIGSREYECPYNLDFEEDKAWLDSHYDFEEFEDIEIIDNIEKKEEDK